MPFLFHMYPLFNARSYILWFEIFQLGVFKCSSSAFELMSTMCTPVEPIILVIILVFPSFDFFFFLAFAFCLNQKTSHYMNIWVIKYQSFNMNHLFVIRANSVQPTSSANIVKITKNFGWVVAAFAFSILKSWNPQASV